MTNYYDYIMNNYFAFVDESGVLDAQNNQQPFFAVGFLKIGDTGLLNERLIQRHYDYFSSKREERRNLIRSLQENPRKLEVAELNLLLASTRHNEYKFTNVTYKTLEKYKEFIDTSFEFPLYFCALVIDKTDPLFDSTIYKNYWTAYIKYTKLLCENNCKKNENICLIADYMSKPSDSNSVFEDEIKSLDKVVNVVRAHSETFSLLQLCDLLLGTVVFQWKQAKGFSTGSNREVAKAGFAKHIIDKLNIPLQNQKEYPLAQAITCRNNTYFSVWPLRLSK